MRGRWQRELPQHSDYPMPPDLAFDEFEALRLSRPFFERNLETLREASLEGELRLRLLLAEIGFRLYEISDDADDYKKGAAFYSGIMQQCLKIITDKKIMGGIVNRARGLLEDSSERGQQLRALRKSRGGTVVEAESESVDSSSEKQPRVAGTRGRKAKRPAAAAKKSSRRQEEQEDGRDRQDEEERQGTGRSVRQREG